MNRKIIFSLILFIGVFFAFRTNVNAISCKYSDGTRLDMNGKYYYTSSISDIRKRLAYGTPNITKCPDTYLEIKDEIGDVVAKLYYNKKDNAVDVSGYSDMIIMAFNENSTFKSTARAEGIGTTHHLTEEIRDNANTGGNNNNNNNNQNPNNGTNENGNLVCYYALDETGREKKKITFNSSDEYYYSPNISGVNSNLQRGKRTFSTCPDHFVDLKDEYGNEVIRLYYNKSTAGVFDPNSDPGEALDYINIALSKFSRTVYGIDPVFMTVDENAGNNNNKPPIGYDDIGGDDFDLNCEGVLGIEFKEFLNNYIFLPLKIVAPILLLIFTTLDFSKVVFSDDKDGMKKAQGNFIKRTIAVIALFLLTYILDLIFTIIGNGLLDSCL